MQSTPFFLNHGRLTPFTGMSTENTNSAEYAGKMQQITAKARKCMLAAQQWQKHYYDQKHIAADHGVGTDVLL